MPDGGTQGTFYDAAIEVLGGRMRH
jgi:hypothetical protein